MLKERKIFKEALASRQESKESPGTASNKGYKYADAHAAETDHLATQGMTFTTGQHKAFNHGFDAARLIA